MIPASLSAKVDAYATAKAMTRSAAEVELIEAGLRAAGTVQWQVDAGFGSPALVVMSLSELQGLMRVLGFSNCTPPRLKAGAMNHKPLEFGQELTGRKITVQTVPKIRAPLPE